MQWSIQAANTVTEAKRELHALNLINPYFTEKEMKQLVTSNYYSVLYNYCKTQLMAASASALKLCTVLT